MIDKYDGAKFIHFQEDSCLSEAEQHYGGATVAYKVVDGKTYVGVAYCHPKDRYVKAYGRARAMGMLKQVMARPEVDGSFAPFDGVTNVIYPVEVSHEGLIELMEDFGYVAR